MGYKIYYGGSLQLDKKPTEQVMAFFKNFDIKDVEVPEQATLFKLSAPAPRNDDKWTLEPEEEGWENSSMAGLRFIIDNIMEPNGIKLNGYIYWECDDRDDDGRIVVTDNEIKKQFAETIYKDIEDKTEQKLKTFYFRMEEHNGERSYHYDYLIYATDETNALEIAKEYASDFYGDGGKQDEDGDNRWEFDGGAIAVEIDVLREMSESDYATMFFNAPHILNPHNTNIPKHVHVGGESYV